MIPTRLVAKCGFFIGSEEGNEVHNWQLPANRSSQSKERRGFSLLAFNCAGERNGLISQSSNEFIIRVAEWVAIHYLDLFMILFSPRRFEEQFGKDQTR